ncbi:MAG TPA: hypothetical protein VF163_13555 [Micromonosporaceae bacterium]
MTDLSLWLSPLPKTWIIDLDGVVLRHNGHLAGREEVLHGASHLWAQFGPDDLVIVMSARHEHECAAALAVLRAHGLRVDRAVFGVPVGERILINDDKPSGLRMAHAVNLPRDEGLGGIRVVIDETR